METEQVTVFVVETGGAEEPPSTTAAKTAGKAKREKKVLLPLLPTGTRYDAETMRPGEKPEGSRTYMSWNVAGLRGLLKKSPDACQRLVDLEGVDVLCLQEHKLQEKHVEEVEAALSMGEWQMHWNCSTIKAGYSGVAMMWRKAAFAKPPTVTCGLGKHSTDWGEDNVDKEGRVITLEFDDMYVVGVYVPNSGAGLKRLEHRIEEWDVSLDRYLANLRRNKPVIVMGDMNCAREPIDIHNARNNVKSAGFTPEERASFQKLYMDQGWVDTFRQQHPDVHGYTYFSHRFDMRNKKKGWRLDYVLVSPELARRCHDSFILQDFLGSDHCPIGLTLECDFRE